MSTWKNSPVHFSFPSRPRRNLVLQMVEVSPLIFYWYVIIFCHCIINNVTLISIVTVCDYGECVNATFFAVMSVSCCMTAIRVIETDI